MIPTMERQTQWLPPAHAPITEPASAPPPFQERRPPLRQRIFGPLLVVGAVLLIARLDVALARVTTPIASGAAALLSRLGPRGLAGQAVVGALLGALWTPCGGPTLGGAIGLAAQRRSLGAAAAVMAAYSVGAVVPVLLLAYGSRRLVARPDRLARVMRVGKPAVGALLMLVGVLSVTGADKALETRLLDVMPAWLVELTTRL
jgi:hypothetical protein